MKCGSCAKAIPDGFADCPWCGTACATIAGSPFDAVPSPPSALKNALVWTGVSLCSACVVVISHFAVLRAHGPREYNSAFVIGRTIGSYLIPAICVLVYYRLSGRKPSAPVKLLVISCFSVLWALIALGGVRPRPSFQSEMRSLAEAGRQSQARPTRTVPPTKWDPAIHSFFDDVRSFHANYVSAVSKTETLPVALYSPDSFRDGATIQEALTELRARLAISGEFSSPERLLDKMPQYLNGIDASEGEKKSFLEGFGASARKDLSARKIVSNNERIWAESAIDLYNFALAHENDFSVQNRQVVFQRKGEEAEFARKLEIAQLRQLEFLNVYRRFIAAQSASLAQLGLPPLDIGGRPPTASSVSDFLSHASQVQGADAKSSH
jgi:hypothetical protein